MTFFHRWLNWFHDRLNPQTQAELIILLKNAQENQLIDGDTADMLQVRLLHLSFHDVCLSSRAAPVVDPSRYVAVGGSYINVTLPSRPI